MTLRSFFPTLCIALALFCVPFLAGAQPGGPGPDPDPGPGTSVPFDGGLSLLIAAGIGYASKKAYDKRKAAKAEVDK